LQTTTLLQRLTDASGPIPFFVSLNSYRANDPEPLAWLRERWKNEAHELQSFDTLRRQGRILLMADALNEMEHAGNLDARISLWRDMLPDFIKDGNQAVFTCRAIDIGGGLSCPDLTVPQADVQPLTLPQMRNFLEKFKGKFEKEFQGKHFDAESVFTWIEVDPQHRSLFSTPFFLDVLARQVGLTGVLPASASRAALFAGFIRAAMSREIVNRHPLFSEDKPDALVLKRDRDWLRDSRNAKPYDLPAFGPLMDRLSALSYGMQRDTDHTGGRREQQVRVSEGNVLAMLDHPRARDILDAGMRLNLIDELLGPASIDVQFSHQLFQEFFAARVLAQQPNPALASTAWRAAEITPSVSEQLAALGKGERLPELRTTGWEETAQVAAAMTPDADAFVRGLMAVNLPLAGRCAAAPGVSISSTLKSELQIALVNRSRDPEAHLRARIDAGLALGLLGDPRHELKHGTFGDYLLPRRMIAISGGTYRIGDAASDQKDENTEIEVELAPFEMGQFAVTNAEFALFVKSGGYDEERWWETDAAKAWREGKSSSEGQKQLLRENRNTVKGWSDESIRELGEQGRLDDEYWLWLKNMPDDEFEARLSREFPEGERYTRPRFVDDIAFNAPLQPVVGICWHEARAYCAWLSEQEGRLYRLPTEHEWEAAARGIERRVYAYGDAFDPTRGNTFETRLQRTTPVGVFPAGDTPEGLSDMSGNTWDWTLNPYREQHEAAPDLAMDDPDVRRVLRGGSWLIDQFFARAAYRGRFNPFSRGSLFGFRLVRPCF
jgi:formylglycine-generating enzyme required for sulfatase activity